jgi:hypothetical protein
VSRFVEATGEVKVMRIKFDMAQKIIFSNSDTKDYYVEKILQ